MFFCYVFNFNLSQISDVVFLHHGVSLQFLRQVKRRKTDKNEVSGLAKHVFTFQETLTYPLSASALFGGLTISGPGSTGIYTDLKIKIIFIYYIHVFFSKKLWYIDSMIVLGYVPLFR